MVHDNALYVGAAEGRLTPEVVGYYLSNIRHLLHHTPLHLERARVRALARGEHSLAHYFAVKATEERGHDRWADDDLRRLRDELGAVPDGGHAPGLLGLIRFIEATIDRDPIDYLAYILFAEYLIALMGPEWLALIEERCGIPMRMFSVISKHAELDRDHTAEGLETIDRLVRAPAKLPDMRAVLRRTFVYFDQFSAEVVAFEGSRSCRTSSAA
jgi:hypothetical protein